MFLPWAPDLIATHAPCPSQHFNPFPALHLIHGNGLPLTDHVHIFLIFCVFVSPPEYQLCESKDFCLGWFFAVSSASRTLSGTQQSSINTCGKERARDGRVDGGRKGWKVGGMEEWVQPRAPEDERGQASALGLSSFTAYLSPDHCLAWRGGRASEHPDMHSAVSLRQLQSPSPTRKGLRHGPATRGCLLSEQGMSDE